MHINKGIALISLSLCIFASDAFAYSLGRPKVGLVLGGGGARGAAHVGVLKVLEENKIPIDYIVGTSMGAIVGGLYASGVSPEKIEETLNSTDWNDLFTDRPSDKDLAFRNRQDRRRLIDFEMGFKKGKFLLPKGLIAGQKLSFLLKSMTLQVSDVEYFDKLPIPFRAIATDIEKGEAVVLEKGNLAEAMRASMSVPGVFSPAELEGRTLVDGGITNNLPVDIARKMGADIIIAVDVSVQLVKREELESMIDITGQVMAIMTLQNVKEQIAKLAEKDILIAPELGNISTIEFEKAPQIIKLGEDAAHSVSAKLKDRSVSQEEYQVFLSGQRKQHAEPEKIDYVEIAPPARVSPKKIEAKIRTKPGQALDTETLRDDLTRVYTIGDFEQVDFRLLKKEGKGGERQPPRRGLLVDTKEKPWGPNYLRFGVNVTDDFEGDSYYNLITQYTMTQLNRLGGEWKNEAQIGRTRKFLSEFYQPLNYSELFFIAPKFEYERSVTNIYSDGHRVADYKVATLSGGVDLGINFGTHAEGRIGITKGTADAKALVGGESLPKFSINQAAWKGSLVYDQFDNSNFPHYGIVAHSNLFMAQKSLGADESYNKLDFGAIKATTFHKKHTILAGIEGGTNLGRDVPFYDEFTLGGFLSLSGYRKGELRGQYYGLGRLLYYYKLGRFSPVLGNDIYVGGSLETGNVWNKVGDIDIDNLLSAGSGFVGVDTIFGPLYLGYGLAERRDDGEIYLFLGQTF